MVGHAWVLPSLVRSSCCDKSTNIQPGGGQKRNSYFLCIKEQWTRQAQVVWSPLSETGHDCIFTFSQTKFWTSILDKCFLLFENRPPTSGSHTLKKRYVSLFQLRSVPNRLCCPRWYRHLTVTPTLLSAPNNFSLFEISLSQVMSVTAQSSQIE